MPLLPLFSTTDLFCSSPLDKYLVNLDRMDGPARFIAASPKLDLTSIVTHVPSKLGKSEEAYSALDQAHQTLRKHNILGAFPDTRDFTTLDDSQLDALRRIVSKELAIVQGPPGTGKTFTSVSAIRVMLANRQPGDPPIIVSAQTNHALDQILTHCQDEKHGGANIMRIGGRTDDEKIKSRTVYELRQKAGRQADGLYRALEASRRKNIDKIQSLAEDLFGDLVTPLALFEAGVITEVQFKSLDDATDWEMSDSSDTPMESWLGEARVLKIRQPDDHVFDDDEEEEDDNLNEYEFDQDLDKVLDDDDEDDRIQGTFVSFNVRWTGKTPQIRRWESKCEQALASSDDLWEIDPSLRGGVYQVLERRFRNSKSKMAMRDLLKEAGNRAGQMKANKWVQDIQLIHLHAIDVVGCTTTGLTKYRGFLAAMQPRTLLIEEAAETREANVASALYPTIQQLVLVGDHQQLTPQCDIARLQEEPFNLNVSMFERLVENGVPFTMLNRQRRMAPEIRHIVSQFYPELQDHPSVLARAPVPGMGHRRSFFFTHEWPEDTDIDHSKSNSQEAEMVVRFMAYLINNGTKAKNITVLTYYNGQKKKIIQKLRNDSLLRGSFFNVHTVDSFQGEENDIILLSLVRSPKPDHPYNSGFLISSNRATVAISRARQGFFMFGNKINLFKANEKSFEVWARVWNGFADQERVAMGKGLPVICRNHGEETWMKDAEDFLGNAGGCAKPCGEKLPCGHDCLLRCHTMEHDKLPCTKPCTRVLRCGHKCSGCCTDKCSCAENCRDFLTYEIFQSGTLPARDALTTPDLPLQSAAVVSNSTRPSPGTLSNSGSGSGSGRQLVNNAGEWNVFTKNVRHHDETLRQERLAELAEPIPATSVATSPQGDPKGKAKETIQETFFKVQVDEVSGQRHHKGQGRIAPSTQLVRAPQPHQQTRIRSRAPSSVKDYGFEAEVLADPPTRAASVPRPRIRNHPRHLIPELVSFDGAADQADQAEVPAEQWLIEL